MFVFYAVQEIAEAFLKAKIKLFLFLRSVVCTVQTTRNESDLEKPRSASEWRQHIFMCK